jgi:2-succinyl-5-enolpyruvyl-6-hydroxy-3-cyclohexene-1-carboxylate synthase
MSLGDVSLASASVVVDELVGAGVRHACISPGSRSTPIALALERHPDITTHIHLDERSSAFFALGVSRATRAPVVVATTSGTAAAELLPAVVEAFYSRAPLILVTADRPPRLRGTGANQTIDQVELYGSHAVFVELPLPSEPVPAARLRTIVGDALLRGSFPHVPVHLNMPFDEPLMPQGDQVPLVEALPEERRREVGASVRPTEQADALAAEISDRRGVVLLGRTIEGWIDDQMYDVLKSPGWPVLAEPVSNGRLPGDAFAAGQALIGSGDWLAAHAPEVVLQIGTLPTTRATQGLVAGAERLVVIDGHFPEPDPEGRAVLRIRENPIPVFDELSLRPFAGKHATALGWVAYQGQAPPAFEGMMARRVGPAPAEWLATWQAADAVARRAMDAVLDSTDEPTELRLARDLAAWIPSGGSLFVGNSMPVRDLDYAMAPREGLRVLANRGASGIDGLISTALGIATVNEGPAAALIGDLSFLHDAGALLWNGRNRADLTLVIANNAGGTIFSFLPQRELPEFEKLFATPQGIEIEMVCEAAGVRYTRVDDMGVLQGALDSAAASGGINVVEVIVDPDRNLAQHREVQAAVDAALRELT